MNEIKENLSETQEKQPTSEQKSDETQSWLDEVADDKNNETKFYSTAEDRENFSQFGGEMAKSAISSVEGIKLQNTELQKIPTEDLAAVRLYTAENGPYKSMNEALRNGDLAELKKLEPQIKCMESGLNQLPDYKGVVTRGVELTSEQAATYEVGKTITEQQFTSTSFVESRAFPGNTKFTIMSEHGKKIDMISEHQTEKEVLFNRGTQFKVLSNDFDSMEGINRIRLYEVETDGGDQ